MKRKSTFGMVNFIKMFNATRRDYWFVASAGILSGLIVFFGQIFKNVGLSLIEVTILPYVLTLVFLGPLLIANKKYRPQKGTFKIWVLYGFIGAVVGFAEFGAVYLGLPVAIAVLLLYTEPLWTVIFSRFILKEKITQRTLLALLVVIIGIVILINPTNFGVGIRNWWGFLVALIGGVGLSGWIVVGSFVSKRKSHPVATAFMNIFSYICFILILYPFFFLFTKNPQVVSFSLIHPLKIWIYILVFNIFAQTIKNLLYYKGVQKVPTADAGIILLLEPVAAVILAAIFLHQSLTLNIIIGGILILLANYLVIGRK